MNKEELITFRQIGSYELSNMKQDTPSCFNGIVRIEKYKITVEKIEEEKEIYKERLQELWDTSTNRHDYMPLKNKADSLGIQLTGDRGSRKK
jgi:hypothetical protein